MGETRLFYDLHEILRYSTPNMSGFLFEYGVNKNVTYPILNITFMAKIVT